MIGYSWAVKPATTGGTSAVAMLGVNVAIIAAAPSPSTSVSVAAITITATTTKHGAFDQNVPHV